MNEDKTGTTLTISQQLPGVMETYTYWHVASNKENPFKKVLGLIYRFKYYKMKLREVGHKNRKIELLLIKK